MIIYLVGRRGSGKTTLALSLEKHGFNRVHPASIAEELDLPKDVEGSYIGVGSYLLAAISKAGPLVVVDGAPRTQDQREVVVELGRNRPYLVVELNADEALSAARMRGRGNTAEAVLRAHRRWVGSEERIAASFERLVLEAVRPTEDIALAVLAALETRSKP